jgi:hypothetical protein
MIYTNNEMLLARLSGCLTKNHAERFGLKIRFPLYFYSFVLKGIKLILEFLNFSFFLSYDEFLSGRERH